MIIFEKTRGNLKTTISANWTVFTGSKSPREMTHSSAFRKVALWLLCKNTRNKANTSVRHLSGFHQERYLSWFTQITQRWSAVLNQQWLCSRLLTLYWVILTRKQVYIYLWTTLYILLLHTRKAFSLTILTKKTAGRILPYGPCHTVIRTGCRENMILENECFEIS